ncbi:MAG TPA: hypothetical protein VGG39_23340 [Polyangiaceae bacterium]
MPGALIETQAATVLPPVQGALACVQLSNAVQIVDLTTLPSSPAGDGTLKNPVGRYVRITLRGGDGYYATGNNASTLAAISPTSYSTVAANGKITLTNNEASIIPAGSYADFVVAGGATSQLPPGGLSPCRYVALVASTGTPVAEIHQSGT